MSNTPIRFLHLAPAEPAASPTTPDVEKSISVARALIRRVHQSLQESDEFLQAHGIDRARARSVLSEPANAQLVREIERRLMLDPSAVQSAFEEAARAVNAGKRRSIRGIRRRPSI